MRFDLLTIFPEFFDTPLNTSILGRALKAGKVECHVHNLRDWTQDKHHCTDDAPYGGGGGMVMLADVLLRAIRDVRAQAAGALDYDYDHDSDTERDTERDTDTDSEKTRLTAGKRRPPVIYLNPQGEVLNHRIVRELADEPGLILLCGSYEGIDERVAELEIDREISIGDYVLTSGELPALVLINAVVRHIEGVLGNPDSAANDSFENGLLDFPHYTRPEVFEGQPVPPVLISGHHAKIVQWRREQSLERTARRRPDLLAKIDLTWDDQKYLSDLGLMPPPPESENPKYKKRRKHRKQASPPEIEPEKIE